MLAFGVDRLLVAQEQVTQPLPIWIVDAHGYGKRFIVRSGEMLTAFVELQRAIHEFAVSLVS